jgi:competence/damage-inducible protein CinA-like protein
LNAEIIAIGTELLLGEITDTNSARIARSLRGVGLDLWWISAVGDNEARIAEAVAQGARRSNVVITSGGLGPTVDDPTRAAVARAFSLPIEYRPELWQQIEARFQRFGRAPTENNRKQAYVPAGALALENPVGTAPCFVVEHAGGVVISLPGVPRELDYMLEHAVLPYLRQKFQLASTIVAKTLRTVGIGESLIDARIADLEELSNPTVGLAAHAGQTDIRIVAKAPTIAEAEAMIAPIAADLRQRLGEFIYGEDQATVEAVVATLLAGCGQTLALAEAGTRGQLAQRLQVVAEAVAVLRGAEYLEAPKPAPEQAQATRAANGADWALAVVVQPREDGGLSLDIALAGAKGVEAHTLGYGGHPELAIRWAATAALNLLRLALVRGVWPPA